MFKNLQVGLQMTSDIKDSTVKRNNLRVKFHFDRLHCHDEAGGWGNAEPYMWTVFFMIDGTTCRLNDSLMLEGKATIFSTPGSYGNLADSDVDAGDTIPIPSAIGLKEMTLTPIPVPDTVKETGTGDIPALAGCFVVLMEDDNISIDEATNGHQALNANIEQVLNNLIPKLRFAEKDISEVDIKNFIAKIPHRLDEAVYQLNFLEDLSNYTNGDYTIGTAGFTFCGDHLLERNETKLHKRWTNANGDWELLGTVIVAEQMNSSGIVVKGINDAELKSERS